MLLRDLKRSLSLKINFSDCEMRLEHKKGKTCRYCNKYFKYSDLGRSTLLPGFPNRLHIHGICTLCQIALHRLFSIKGYWKLKYKVDLPLAEVDELFKEHKEYFLDYLRKYGQS